MLTSDKLEKFAELAVRVGINLQPGEEVAVRADVAAADFARLVARKAYEFGAKRAFIQWSDEKMSRLDMECAGTETLCEVPSFEIARNDYYIERRCCLVSIASGDPNIFSGCDAEKIAKVDVARSRAFSAFRKATMSNFLRWTIVSVPTEAWAKTVFPGEAPAAAVERLWESIAVTMRLNEPDPTAAWRSHIETLHRRAKFLNEHRFDALRFSGGNGTDLEVGLADGHLWLAAEELGQDGIPFTANMPTEEIFTAPHRLRTNGVVKNALPLVHNGTVIDGFSLTFREGKVTDYWAEKGLDALKGLLGSDEGVLRLGEVALIGKSSPISRLGVLFFNTLFDENASCHLALGKAYPTTVEGGSDLSADQLLGRGANDSLQHVDFMIGTDDLRVEGLRNGEKTLLFEDGDWVI